MNYDEMKAKVDAALKEHQDRVNANEKYTPELKEVFNNTTADFVARLFKLADMIRNQFGPLCESDSVITWRTANNIREDLLAEGQAITRYLFTCNLRDKITDLIENHYGVSFSALGVFPRAIDPNGKCVYVAYHRKDHPRVSLYVDGVFTAVDKNDFEHNYKYVKS